MNFSRNWKPKIYFNVDQYINYFESEIKNVEETYGEGYRSSIVVHVVVFCFIIVFFLFKK